MTDTDLMYQKCSECLNEGWLFCTLCHKYFCDEHACQHLAAQVNKDALRDMSEDSQQSQDIDAESKAFFRELSAEQLLDKSEIALRSYFRRLLQEAKRVQREIERRMIYATELTGGPAYRRQPQPSSNNQQSKKREDLTPLGLLERQAKEQKVREREQKRQQTIQASIALLAEQIKLGNISMDQLKKIGGKK